MPYHAEHVITAHCDHPEHESPSRSDRARYREVVANSFRTFRGQTATVAIQLARKYGWDLNRRTRAARCPLHRPR
jgi:hypothetical protein